MTNGDSSNSGSRLREIFIQAREIPDGGERKAYLEKACAGDDALRRGIDSLLGKETASEAFLEGATVSPGQVERENLLGTVIDHYQIVERLGEGGFGEVFRVEQTEPVRRELALKIIKPGMDSREVIARFEGERQALALMDHPNIARVVDAGTTKTGRPYFVMELARGKPITTYCDRKQLSIVDRLRLFAKVCAAVQHAHQKGIIHRDLKPSNIVITTSPATGEAIPKIIDFGIAKSLQGPLTGRTLITQREVLLGTPAYMSPEQLELGSDRLDTRTDIYALGILLYELLAGVQPFERKTLERAAFSEVQRIIREVEPPKPSDRVHTLGKSAATVAQTRMTPKPTLERALRGDLDWIVMKAIEKERDRRYQGAAELADDISRYLESKPVEAGPPDRVYRMKKFVRRHRVGVSLTSALVVAILTGFVLVTIGFTRASRERDRARLAELVAEAEAVRVKAVQSLYEPYRWHEPNLLRRYLMLGSNEEPAPSSRDLRDSLNNLASRLDENPPGLQEVERRLRKTLADSYVSLEMTAEAIVQLDRVVEIARQTYGTDDVRYADSLVDKASALNRGFSGLVEFSFGYSHRKTNPVWQIEEAARLGAEALAIYRRHDHVSPYVMTALQMDALNDREGCDTQWLEMAELSQKIYGPDSIMTLGCLQQLAICLGWKGRFEEAEPLILQYQEALRRVDDGPYTIPHSMAPTVGLFYNRAGRPEEAERIYREEITRLENKVRGVFNTTYGGSLLRLDKLLDAQGRSDPEVKAKLAQINLWRELDPALCRVDYALRIPEPGRYRLYLRWDGFDARSDNIAVRLRELQDGVGGEIADVFGLCIPGFPGDADFATVDPWQDRANFETNGNHQTGTHATEWLIEEPGTYTLQLIGTETGAAVDAFILQRSDLPRPAGVGPPRTAQNPDRSYSMADGRVVVEAENPSSRLPGRITDWVSVPEDLGEVVGYIHFTGSGYLQVLPESDGITNSELLRNRSSAALIMGDPWRALELTDQAVALDPSAESYFRRGLANESLGDYRCALEDFQKALDINPNNWAPYPHLWDSHLRVGNNDVVIDLIRPYVEVEGGMEWLKLKYARARANKGLWQEAIDGIQPQEPGDTLWLMRGDLYADHGHYPEARREYSNAVKNGRSSLRPYGKLAALYLVDGDRAAYETCLESIPPLRENDLDSYRLYLWQSSLGPDTCPDPEGLEAIARHFLKLSEPTTEEGRLHRAELAGAALYRAGDFQQAVGLLTEAQEIDAKPYGTYRCRSMFFVAMALQQEGRTNEAMTWFARARDCLAEERESIPANEDPAYPTPWDHKVAVESLEQEAANRLTIREELDQFAAGN
ncbi:MAG: protein kinase [Opitutaceae bacterium]